MIKSLENNVEQSAWATCMALHDFAYLTTDVIRGLFEHMEILFEHYGLVPTKSGLTYREKKSPPKLINFKTAKKRLYEQKFEDIRSINLTARAPNDDDIGFIWLSLSRRKEPKDQENGFYLVFDNNLMSFDPNILFDICQKASLLLNPRYGYLYKRRFAHGPEFYPVGIGSGSNRKHPVSDEERNNIAKWGHHVSRSHIDKFGIETDLSKYKTGDMRDIYPGNILSKAHADHVVEGLPFLDWITAKPHRGTLTPIQENLWLWWVEDEHIPNVREELRSTGFVICI